MPCLPYRLAAAAAVVLLQACAARNEPGWQGQDATAFGGADSTCVAESRDLAAAERDLAYRACMARHGWTPGRGEASGD